MHAFVRCYALHRVGCIAQGERLKPGVVKITVVAPIKKLAVKSGGKQGMRHIAVREPAA